MNSIASLLVAPTANINPLALFDPKTQSDSVTFASKNNQKYNSKAGLLFPRFWVRFRFIFGALKPPSTSRKPPKALQATPRTLQRAPRASPEGGEGSQAEAKLRPGCPQGSPKTPSGPPRTPPGLHFCQFRIILTLFLKFCWLLWAARRIPDAACSPCAPSTPCAIWAPFGSEYGDDLHLKHPLGHPLTSLDALGFRSARHIFV